MLTDKQLQMYNTLVRKIYASSSLQELCICVLSGLQSLVPYDSATFFLINSHTSELSQPLFFDLDTSGIDYIACVQIFHQGHLSGRLTLHRKQEQEDFSDQEMLVLNLFHEHLNDRFSGLNLRMHNSASQVVNEEWCLTKREAQIASLVTRGRTNKQIAFDLGLSENTIKTLLKRLFNKMGVHSRSELISALYKLAPSISY